MPTSLLHRLPIVVRMSTASECRLEREQFKRDGNHQKTLCIEASHAGRGGTRVLGLLLIRKGSGQVLTGAGPRSPRVDRCNRIGANSPSGHFTVTTFLMTGLMADAAAGEW
jgi:hypothetical protein